MSIKNNNFERYTLDNDYEKPDIISVRLNVLDRELLDLAKDDLGVDADSTALKMLLKLQYNYVIHTKKIIDDEFRKRLSID